MSISPIDAQRSSKSSSSRALSQSPNSTHGFCQLPDLAGSSDDVGEVRSMHISASEFDFENSGSVAAAAADSRWSSEKMIDLGTQDIKQATYCQHRGSFPQSPLAGGGGTSSQLRFDQSKHAHLKGKQSKPNSPSHFEQQPPSDFGVTHSSATTHSAGRRNQMMNANHLLNFQYDPIARPLPRPPPPRKPHKIKPYNKDLFLQANFKFVVLDSGNYVIESMDPDKMLEWEDIVCVKYSTPFPVQCPICLETPLCPQITTCGHIFCFPCILRYLLMGKEDHKGDCWKKCPLCFMAISSKELYTIYINYVKQYHIGENVEFALLTRAKDSLVPSQKDRSGDDVIDDFFSKITFTSDVELAVREAHMELNDWLTKADCGLLDDLEQLPYVCAAREQLEERKKHWAENQTLSSSPPLHATTTNRGSKFISNKTYTHVFSSVGSTEAPASVTLESVQGRSCSGYQDELKGSDVPSLEKLGGEDFSESSDGLPDAFHTPEKSVLSHEDGINMQKDSGDYKDVKDAYTFYQAVDGQHLILHSLNMKCLLHHYGSHDLLPSRIGGKILQLETVTQSEAMRRRYRYLSHFSLTTIFQLCEIDMSDILPPDAISPFMDEIKKRRNQRKRLAKKENVEQARAEAAAMHAIPISSNVRRSSSNDAIFSIDDFEALGNSTVPSTSPSVAGDKKLFSHVTRLGFASAHDSPSLRIEETVDALNNKEATDEAANLTGLRGTTMSFANIISADKYASPSERGAKENALGKKGKKPSRVLLSTAGGRRY